MSVLWFIPITWGWFMLCIAEDWETGLIAACVFGIGLWGGRALFFQ